MVQEFNSGSLSRREALAQKRAKENNTTDRPSRRRERDRGKIINFPKRGRADTKSREIRENPLSSLLSSRSRRSSVTQPNLDDLALQQQLLAQASNQPQTPPNRRQRRTRNRRQRPQREMFPAQQQLAYNREEVTANARGRDSEARSRPAPKPKVYAPVLYIIRLLIFGIGIGGIIGSVLSTVDPHNPWFGGFNFGKPEQNPQETVKKGEPEAKKPPAATFQITQELPILKQKIEAINKEYTGLESGVFLVDLDNGNYVDVQGSTPVPAASTIKIPVLMAFFQDLDAGKVRLDEKLTMTKELIGSGSGDMQYQQVGKQFTALEVVTKMIIISDNTATNMIIDRLGGAKALNERFISWGLAHTVINNPLPDLEGTNTTSPKDLGMLLALVNKGELVSLRSRDWIIDIMKRTETRTLLPQGIGKDALIAHKTGDIGTILGDAGIIYMPSGKSYIAVAMVKRPYNDPKGRTMIQRISKEAYQYFEQPPKPVNTVSHAQVGAN